MDSRCLISRVFNCHLGWLLKSILGRGQARLSRYKTA